MNCCNNTNYVYPQMDLIRWETQCSSYMADADNYYTKAEVDSKLEDIVESGCCITEEEVDEKIESAITSLDLSDYALKSEIPTVPTNVSAFNNDAGYLTEHQSLSGYATEQWVESQGYLTEHQSLEGYVTENDLTAYTYDKETIDQKVSSGGTFDPTQYYTTGQTNNLLSLKLDASAYTPTDLSNYYNKQEVNSALSGKQDTLVAGDNITISGNVISATGGGGSEPSTYVSAVTRNNAQSIHISKNNGTNDIYLATINNTGIVRSGSTSLNFDLPTMANFSAHTANTTVHVTAAEKNTWNSKVDSSTLNNYLLKSKIWCGTQSAYDSLTTYDPETLYLIHE